MAAKAKANGSGHADPARIAELEAETAPPVTEVIAAAEQAEAERERAERELAAVQAVMEGAGVDVTSPPTVEFLGKRFRISDKVGLFPLMMFADAAEEGMDTDDPRALAAIWRMLRDCIHPEDWQAFVRHGTDQKCNDTEVMFGVCEQTVRLLTARPSPPPSVSSSGRPARSRSSTGSRSGTRAGGSKR